MSSNFINFLCLFVIWLLHKSWLEIPNLTDHIWISITSLTTIKILWHLYNQKFLKPDIFNKLPDCFFIFIIRWVFNMQIAPFNQCIIKVSAWTIESKDTGWLQISEHQPRPLRESLRVKALGSTFKQAYAGNLTHINAWQSLP